MLVARHEPALTEAQFAAVATACDRLLRAPDTSLARIAIPILHVINEHPGCLEPYRPLAAAWGTGLVDGAAVQASRYEPLRAVARVGRGLFRSLSPAHRDQIGGSAVPVDVLIVSRLLNRRQLSGEDDFYFGPLQRLLAERGASSVVAYINHLADRDPVGDVPASRVILPRTAPPGIEAGIWNRCLETRRQLNATARAAHSEVERSVAALASRHAMFEHTAINLRLHASVARLCRYLEPRVVITTYEGDSSERLIWHAAREGGNRPLCVGYQHTRLLAQAHAIRRRIAAPGMECDPDVILTLGPQSHEALASSPGLGSTRLVEYGSHRRAVGFDAPPPELRPRGCLVLPDGDEREFFTLFHFAAECARANQTVDFIVRPHPIVDAERLRQRLELPGNLTLSVGTPLIDDLARARYCIYRGSSAVVHAVIAGLKPFYLERPGELNFDPLFALSGWRETITSPEDFAFRLQENDRATGSAGRIAAEEARKFCEDYVSPLRPAALDELLSMALSASTDSTG